MKSLNLLTDNLNNMLDHTVNLNMSIYTDRTTDQIIVNFGDLTTQVINLISSKNI